MSATYPQQAKSASNALLFYETFPKVDTIVTIDSALTSLVPLLAKGESAINQQLSDLATIDPGQLDQSRLMGAQMNMSRWQLASQLITNFCSGINTGLKSVVQNVGR
jgi:hypothetical protein